MLSVTTAATKIVKVNDVINVDEEHGLVFGYAIVSKTRDTFDGEFADYYDLNVDQDGVHKGQRVPENITEDAMFKAAVDGAATGMQLAGDEEHAGPDVGSYYFMLPVTEDIAKALDWQVKKTGLVVGYHPGDDEVLKKFKDGTYKGFSITGERVEYEEEDA
jgi:hypothetical protein